MLQDLVGAPDEFEMLDLVHPLVWIWREQQIEPAVYLHIFRDFVIFVTPVFGIVHEDFLSGCTCHRHQLTVVVFEQSVVNT